MVVVVVEPGLRLRLVFRPPESCLSGNEANSCKLREKNEKREGGKPLAFPGSGDSPKDQPVGRE